ncbi:MAG: hypothetical protein WCP86_05135 [bacterium]
MIKTFIILALLMISTSCSAQSLIVRVDQNAGKAEWTINRRQVSEPDFDRLMKRLASIDSNQVVQVVAHTNVTASTLVQTIGVIQRAGLYKIILASPGMDKSTNGTWRVTIDCTGWQLPGCIPYKGGFSTKDMKDLELEIAPQDIR